MAQDKNVMQWVRMNKGEAQLYKIEMPDGSFLIGVAGLSPSDSEWQKLVSTLNFKVSASGRMLLRHREDHPERDPPGIPRRQN